MTQAEPTSGAKKSAAATKSRKTGANKKAATKSPAQKSVKPASRAKKPKTKPVHASEKKPAKMAAPAAENVAAASAVAANAAAKNAAAENKRQKNPADENNLIDDFDALSEYLADVSGKSQEALREVFARQSDLKNISDPKSGDPLNVSESMREMMNALAADPGTVMQRQFNLWGDYAKLMATMSRRMAGEEVAPAVEPAPGDKRFTHPAWKENHLLDFVKQSYLTYGNWLRSTVHELDGMDDHEKRRAEFFTQQFIDAIAPTNFPALNPEVVEATIESRGENLMKGLRNYLEDVDRGNGELSIRQADMDYFKLGENVATTPGKIVYQNDIMQLIQYNPMTEKVGKRPLLIFPPWINKFYILDLQPANSFIRWAVEQGRTVFIVSWVNPAPDHSQKIFADYIHEGLFDALDAVRMATGEEEVDAIGYCIGGTMLSTGLALMARRGDKRVKSATFFTAQADFTEAGDLLLFVDEDQLDALEKQMDAAGGVLEGRAMATTFNMLRSNDLIWSFVIDNYMKGKDPARFDLLFWNSDATRMPKDVHLFYLREFYQRNRLARGEMVIDGETLDLGEIDLPIFMQAGETDHIAPYNSIYNTARLFGAAAKGNVTYMLAGSGHIAGVVNHPSKNKYHHSVNSSLPDSVEEWKAGATRHPGSWWPHWMEWLRQTSPGEVPARTPGDGDLTPIEDAPGSYVKVKA